MSDDKRHSPASRLWRRIGGTRAGLIVLFVGFLVLSAGLRSGRRTTVDDIRLYGGFVIVPLGIILTLHGVIAASYRRREAKRSTGRGFDVGTPPQDHP